MSLALEWQQDRSGGRITGLMPEALEVALEVECGLPQGQRRIWQPRDPRPDGEGWTFQQDSLQLAIRKRTLDGGLVVEGDVVNVGDKPVNLHHVRISLRSAALFTDLANARVFLQGFQSWTPTRSVPSHVTMRKPLVETMALMTHDVDSPYWPRRDGLHSHGVVVFRPSPAQGTAGDCLLAGHLTHRVGLSSFFLENHGEGCLVADLDFGGRRVDAHESLTLERLWLCAGQGEELLTRWAMHTGKGMEARIQDRIPVGWCSWYEYYAKVKEQDVVGNADFLSRHRPLGVELVQLDDGYQTAVGDWLSINNKFPRGLAPLAEEIKSKGFAAGIWTAPFFAARGSRLFTEHPDWLLRTEKGEPVFCGYSPVWNARVYALDLSHPDVRSHLTATFKSLREMGFTYFKVDFMFAGVRKGVRKDVHGSPVEWYRSGLMAIREGIGWDSFLLGCGAPIGPSIGFMDGMRISQDVKEEWDSAVFRAMGPDCSYPTARGAIRNIITRAFMHRRLWLNDPDCLLVRDRNTRLSHAEVESLVTVLGVSGGMLFLSDNLPHLSAERLAMAETVLPPTSLTGHASHLMDHGRPDTVILQGEFRQLWALLNDGDQPRHRTIAPPKVTTFDFWRAKVVEKAELQIPSHGVRALICTPHADHPQVVGADLNLTALVDGRITDSFDAETCVLRVQARDLARSHGRLWIRIGGAYKLDDVHLPPGVKLDTTWSGGWVLKLNVALPCDVRIPFSLVR